MTSLEGRTGRAVVTFDFHNTLVECDRWFELEIRSLCSETMKEISSRNGRRETTFGPEELDRQYAILRKEIQDHGNELDASQSVIHVLDRLGLPVDDGEIDRAIDTLMRSALESAQPVDGAAAALAGLSASGIPIGVVSSAVHHDFLEWSLERFGLRDSIENVTTSASAGYYKSRPEIYWHALEHLDGIPGRSVHVGDSRTFDVTGAQRAGMKAIWFSRGIKSIQDDDHTPDAVVDSMHDSREAAMSLLQSE